LTHLFKYGSKSLHMPWFLGMCYFLCSYVFHSRSGSDLHIYIRENFLIDLHYTIEGGGVNLCGVSFLLLLLWLSWCVLQWGGVRVEAVDILALAAS
jgi:hypothetical protein